MPHPGPGKQRRNWEGLLLNTSSVRYLQTQFTSTKRKKASQACGLGNLSPSSDFELHGQEDLKKNNFVRTDAINLIFKDNSCDLQ